MKPTTARLKRAAVATAILLLPACGRQAPRQEPTPNETERPRPPAA
jgi:outer membrane biogenesis lipoprotein LolB